MARCSWSNPPRPTPMLSDCHLTRTRRYRLFDWRLYPTKNFPETVRAMRTGILWFPESMPLFFRRKMPRPPDGSCEWKFRAKRKFSRWPKSKCSPPGKTSLPPATPRKAAPTTKAPRSWQSMATPTAHYFNAKSTTHTAISKDPWWQVDLGQSTAFGTHRDLEPHRWQRRQPTERFSDRRPR